MAVTITDKAITEKLNNQLSRVKRETQDSIEKLATGQVFTSGDPRPADAALATGLEFKLRSLAASKRNINDAVSLLSVAEGGMSEINNIVVRMKEIGVAAASTTVSDRERGFLLTEYQALHDEINRIALSTEFNGMPLLNGDDEKVPEILTIRVDDPLSPDGDTDNDVNAIRFDSLKQVIATTTGLGIKSAAGLLKDAATSGVSVEDAADLLESSASDYATAFEEALTNLSSFRSAYGAIQNRLQRAISFNEVFEENISAAKSRIADTDYASEVARLTQNNILSQAATGLLGQTNMMAKLSLSLVNSILS